MYRVCVNGRINGGGVDESSCSKFILHSFRETVSKVTLGLYCWMHNV